ncbi:hypothetical protein N7532_001951 [Penicillium argentinense]|uniref:Uncharacterized protein n=1 Tax=Penicillium argentinense TaxID=1131581 RepID=A0A9W9G3G4_9EURO|nr:uncharacterized protein N7532_001951 [Penicillium argentinense]KAJ5111416.1 hypothetical protein N7532_001951 [Penicillium argentinense]
MANKIDNYTANIVRLSRFLPGYDQLSGNSTEKVSVSLVDLEENGNFHVHESQSWDSNSSQRDLSAWLTGEANGVATRYILMEDIIPWICAPLGATFDLDPQFFVDHMGNQAPTVSLWGTPRSAHWNTWNLRKPYLSSRWYRPVAYRKPVVGGEKGEVQVKQFLPNSSVFRSELDLSELVVPGFRPGRITAIEERVSIYHVEKDRRRHVIIISDPIPTCRQQRWTTIHHNPLHETEPSIAPLEAEIHISTLYKCLRTSLILETVLSTTSCLRDYAQRPIPNELLLEECLFHIIVSDTQGLLYLLHHVRGTIVTAVVPQNAELEDIFALRTFIANIQSQVPDLKSELEQGLGALLELFPADEAHRTASAQVKIQFEHIILDLSRSLDSITGAVQFMESQRAILEAESITRLTELAFFFIPLSFSAALFSMQVRELSQPLPLAYFVAFALSLSATTYTLRLVVRSSWMQRKKQEVLTSVRKHSSLPPSARVANSAVIAWMITQAVVKPIARMIIHVIFSDYIGAFYQVRYLVLVLTVLLPCLVAPPLAVLWTRQINLDLKIGLTFAILLLTLCILALVILAIPTTREQIKSLLPSQPPDSLPRNTSSREPERPDLVHKGTVAQGTSSLVYL